MSEDKTMYNTYSSTCLILAIGARDGFQNPDGRNNSTWIIYIVQIGRPLPVVKEKDGIFSMPNRSWNEVLAEICDLIVNLVWCFSERTQIIHRCVSSSTQRISRS
jgi:hypothetical protein